MNWFSHWDESRCDKEMELTDSKVISDFEIPTEEEINELFSCDNTVDYKVKMDRKYLSIEELNEICENTKMKVADQILDAGTNRYCPNCGESYYMENYSMSTAMYFPPIYKDGVNINPDRNIHTTYCTCMNCGKEFSYKNR